MAEKTEKSESDRDEEIKDKIEKLFNEKEITVEGYTRILFFLDEKENREPYMKSLKRASKDEKAFKRYLEQLIEDTEKAKSDEKFRTCMRQIHEAMISEKDAAFDDQGARVDPKLSVVAANSGFNWFAAAVGRMGPVAEQRIASYVAKESIRNTSLVAASGRNLAPVALAAAFLAYEAITALWNWWHEKISGKRCAKQVLDSIAAVAAGAGGGWAGVALGTLVLGPVGGMVGGFVGGVASSLAAGALSDVLTQSIFDVPKEVAVENAYIYLGVHHKCSNSEVNTAFRKLCLKHHPDKGGSAKEFHVLQVHMHNIKMSRGDANDNY